MKHRRFSEVIAVAIISCFYGEYSNAATAQDRYPVPQISQEEAFASLIEGDSNNVVGRLEAARILVRQRVKFVENLMAVLNSTNSDFVKLDAAIVLGEYRATEAVPFLVGHLQLDDPRWHGGFAHVATTPLPEYLALIDDPVRRAVEKIGMPAIPVLLERIMRTDGALSPLNVNDIRNLPALVDRLSKHSEAVCSFLWQKCSNDEQVLLTDYQESSQKTNEVQNMVIQLLNRVIGGPPIYELDRFGSFILRDETKWFMKQPQTRINLARLNRLLLEDAFRDELWRNQTTKCVAICVTIEGPEVTKFRLQALLQKANDHDTKERIQYAVDTLEFLMTEN